MSRRDYSRLSNPALLLYRGLRQSPVSRAEAESGKQPVPVLDEIIKTCNAYYGKLSGLTSQIHARQRAQLIALRTRGWSVFALDGAVHWRLVTGTGHGRIWNASLRLHDLYGVPFLPASSLKGALRAYGREKKQETLISLLGAPEEAASLQLFDAFPIINGVPLLRPDVLTKHHKGYMESAESNVPPPVDWDTPEPVSFITVNRGVKFRFFYAIQPARPHDGIPAMIDSFLEQSGVGAKTRKGYGRLRLTPVAL